MRAAARHACRRPRRGRPRPARRARAAPRRDRRARAPRRSGARRGRRARAARTPVSRSSTASCCETADGVNCSASATAAIVPALVQLAQQAQAAQVEHASDATESSSEIGIAPDALRARRIGPCALRHPRSASPPRAAFGAMGIFGKLAYERGRDGRARCSRCASCSPPRCSGRSCSPPAPRAGCARCPGATSRSRLALGAVGYAPRPAPTSRRSSASTRRCSRCCSTRSRRWSRSPRSRSGASGRAGARPARSRSASRRPRRSSWPAPGAGALDPLGHRCWGSRPPSSTAPTSSPRPGVAARVGPLAAQRARLHRRGDDADDRPPSLRRPAPGRRDRAGFGWLPAIAVVSTVGAVSLFFAGLKRVGPTTAVDPLDGRAGGRRSCSRSWPSASR